MERVKLAVVTPDVKRAVRDRRRRGNWPVGRSFPNLTTSRSINRVHISIIASEIDHVVFENRRRDHAIAGRKFPFYSMKLPRRRTGIATGMDCVAAKH